MYMPSGGKSLELEIFMQFVYESLFFFAISWIVCFALAKHDNSIQIDRYFDNISFTFRDWLWVNGSISIWTSIFGLFINIFGRKQMKDNISRGYICLLIIYMAIFMGKTAWSMVGIWYFLYNLTFSQLSDNVLTYCGIEFIAFFAYYIYTTLYLFQKILKCICKIRKVSAIAMDNQVDSNYQPFPIHRIIIALDKDAFFSVCKKIMYWMVIGWAYDFVLWKKDLSKCLDQSFQDISYKNYRNWLLIDGISTLGLMGIWMFFIYWYVISSHKLVIWQKASLLIVNITWLYNHKKLTFILFLASAFKLAWLIDGLLFFIIRLNINNQVEGQDYCSGNIPNFLVAYFTQFAFFVVVLINCLFGACIKRQEVMSLQPIQERGHQQLNPSASILTPNVPMTIPNF